MTTESVQGPLGRRRSGVGAFIGGAWMNRRYTRLSSSLILGVLVAVGFLVLVWPKTDPAGWQTAAMIQLSVWAALNAVLYPLARELYFRLTQPLREGAGLMLVGGILLIIVWIAKLTIFLLLWMLAVPIGVIAFIYLAITDAAGKGWRWVEA